MVEFYTCQAPVEHPVYEDSLYFVFLYTQEEESIFPLSVNEIAEAQNEGNSLEALTKPDKYEIQLVKDTKLMFSVKMEN